MKNAIEKIFMLQKDYKKRIEDIKKTYASEYQQQHIDAASKEFSVKLSEIKTDLKRLVNSYVKDNRSYKASDSDVLFIINLINSLKTDVLPLEVDNVIIDRLKDDTQAHSIINAIFKANGIKRPINARIVKTKPKSDFLNKVLNSIEDITLSTPLFYLKMAIENMIGEPLCVDVGGIGAYLAEKQISNRGTTSFDKVSE